MRKRERIILRRLESLFGVFASFSVRLIHFTMNDCLRIGGRSEAGDRLIDEKRVHRASRQRQNMRILRHCRKRPGAKMNGEVFMAKERGYI